MVGHVPSIRLYTIIRGYKNVREVKEKGGHTKYFQKRLSSYKDKEYASPDQSATAFNC